MKKVKILYALTFFIFLLVSFPPISLLVGMKIFCTESIFVTVLGFETKANLYLPISQFIGLIILVLIRFKLNDEIKKATKKYDDLLEKNNRSVISNYDKFRIEIGYVFPTILTLIFGLLSCLDVYKGSSAGVLLIVFSGAIQIVIAFVVFYNEIQMLTFFKQQKDNI